MSGIRRAGGRVRNQIFRRISGGRRAKSGNVDFSSEVVFEGGFVSVDEGQIGGAALPGIEEGRSKVILARHNCTTMCNTLADVMWESSMYGEYQTRGAGSTARHIRSAACFPHQSHPLGQFV